MLIRLLAYINEADTERCDKVKAFPVIPFDLFGSHENLKRNQIKAMLRAWEKKHLDRVEIVFWSLSTVVPPI